MILKNIKLSNIRSYKSQEVVFPQGSFLLSGDIGAGKSTILLAAEFALFGIMRGNISGENLLRHGAKEGSVELKFEVDEKEVIVKRKLKRTKDSVKQESGYIIIDGKKTEGTHVELKSRILELIGYPKELISKSKSLVYRYTVYTPQEQMKHILFDDKEERLNILRRVFGVDKYRRIAENSQHYMKALREKSKLLEGKMYGLEEKQKILAENRKSFENSEIRMKDMKEKVEVLKSSISEMNIAFAKKEKYVETLKELRRDLGLYNIKLDEKVNLRQKNVKELEQIEKQILETRKKIDSLEVKDERPLKDIEESIQQKDKKIKEILEQKSEFLEKAKHLGLRVKQLKKELMGAKAEDLEAKEKELNELREQIKRRGRLSRESEKIEAEVRELERKIREFEIAKENSESMIKKISKLENCPTCLRPVDKEHKHKIKDTEEGKIKQSDRFKKQVENELSEKMDVLKNIKKEIDSIFESEKKAEKLNAEVNLLKKTQESIAEKQKELASNEADFKNANEKLELLQQENVSALAKDLDKERLLRKKVQEKMHLKDMLSDKVKRKEHLIKMQDEIKKDIGDINKAKIEIDGKLKSMGDAETAYLKVKKEIDIEKEKLRKLEIEEKGFATQADNFRKIISGLEKEVKDKLEARSKLEMLSQIKRWLDEQFLNVVSMIERNVMFRIHSQFKGLFQEWFDMLVEDDALSINLDKSFTPIIEQDGYEASVDGLSGGEKTAIALAYRLSLNKVINGIVGTIKTKDIIILDEPTDGFSSEQLDKVREVIDELNMKQVVIVSHEPKIESFVESVLRIEKRGHVSSVLG